MIVNKAVLTFRKGGAGSGHHGHSGRPGKQGGSSPGGGVKNVHSISIGQKVRIAESDYQEAETPNKVYTVLDVRETEAMLSFRDGEFFIPSDVLY